MSRANIVSIESVGSEEGAIIGGVLGEIAEPLGGGIIGEELGEAVGEEVSGIVVTFSVHGGGTRSYQYDGDAAAAILAGDDPSNYSGERVG